MFLDAWSLRVNTKAPKQPGRLHVEALPGTRLSSSSTRCGKKSPETKHRSSSSSSRSRSSSSSSSNNEMWKKESGRPRNRLRLIQGLGLGNLFRCSWF